MKTSKGQLHPDQQGGENSASTAAMDAEITRVAILERERRSRRHGSGITAQELMGCWQLRHLWNRKAAAQPRQAAGLRRLQASLELRPITPAGSLAVVNAVRIGPLTLRFCGKGQLSGRRPLLQFSFQQLELKLGDRLILRRDLAAPAPSRMPFFALIEQGRDAEGRWLLARGRGGGLACWHCPQPRTCRARSV